MSNLARQLDETESQAFRRVLLTGAQRSGLYILQTVTVNYNFMAIYYGRSICNTNVKNYFSRRIIYGSVGPKEYADKQIGYKQEQ